MHAPHPALSLSRDLVLIGGGHTHALVLRAWAMDPLPGARLTLIAPDPVAEYSGMLPGFVAGAYDAAEIRIDLVRLAQAAGARLILDRAIGIDRAARTVTLAGRGPVAFDIAAIDTGVATARPDGPALATHALPVKPTGPFLARWTAFADGGGGAIVILGAGLGGVEVALAARARLPAAPITLVEAEAQPLREVSARGRTLLLGRLAAAGVRLLTGTRATGADGQAVTLSDGQVLPAALLIAAGGGRPAPWFADTGMVLLDGRVAVDAGLRSSDPAIFAAGDCAILPAAPRPMAGVFAVRAAPVLTANLRAALAGGPPPRRFRPQRDWLRLIAGGGNAVADKWGLAVGGRWVWRWKDRIDRRFMAMLSDLPPMPLPPPPAARAAGALDPGGRPMCGGCGAKVGRAALRRVLADRPVAADRGDVLTGPGDDAAVIVTGGVRQVLTTDHLRAVTADPALMARIAAIHALGDLRAMGARGQAALVSVTLPRMNETLQERTLAEMLDAIAPILAPAGCAVVGGHSATGPELSVGLTLTGLAEAPVGQAAHPGDVLVLTKPIGTGTTLAAAMAGAADGLTVAACWASMATDQPGAASALAGAARAMTDVTGFGLAAHLLGIAEASGATAILDAAAIPLLPGAAALAAAGHASTLAPANRAALAGAADLPDGPLGALLVDPQTAGGLLAAVPPERVADTLAAIAAAGEAAWVIGRLDVGPPRVTVAGTL